MSDTFIQTKEAEFDEVRSAIEAISTRATAEGRDLTDDEVTESDALFVRANSIKATLEAEYAKRKALADTAATFGKFANLPAAPASVRAEGIKDPAEWFMHYCRANGRMQDQASVRALATVTSSQSPGLLPYTIQGDIIKFVDAQRRTIDSLNYFSMPAGATFKRRVQSGAGSVDSHAEGTADLTSGQVTVSYVDVTPTVYAGGIKLNLESDWYTSPEAAALNFQSIVEQYAIKTNTVVAAALKSAASSTVPCPVSGATPQSVIKAIMTAADLVYANSKQEADTIWCTPDVKTWLATLVGSDGQFAFPMLSANNRDGSADRIGSLNSGLSIGGLRLVVDPMFPSSDPRTFIVGSSKFGEVYEETFGTIEAYTPSSLQREIVLAGRLATYFRSEGFIKLVDTDGNTGATPNFG